MGIGTIHILSNVQIITFNIQPEVTVQIVYCHCSNSDSIGILNNRFLFVKWIKNRLLYLSKHYDIHYNGPNIMKLVLARKSQMFSNNPLCYWFIFFPILLICKAICKSIFHYWFAFCLCSTLNMMRNTQILSNYLYHMHNMLHSLGQGALIVRFYWWTQCHNCNDLACCILNNRVRCLLMLNYLLWHNIIVI